MLTSHSEPDLLQLAERTSSSRERSLFDAKNLTEQDRRHAEAIRARGVFADLEVKETVHAL
jgi:hypothetical protein